MKPIIIPDDFNYIAVFLTFSCQLRCSYCINHHGGDLLKGRWMNGDDWIKGLNRIQTRSDLPITIQGGEPTVHKHFFRIINGIKREIPIDLLTNLEISDEIFMRAIQPDRIKREAKYASIRVSYHHGQTTDFERLLAKVKRMQDNGYHIGIWEVACPWDEEGLQKRMNRALNMGIDWRLKEFLGPYKGKNYGTMRYPGAVNGIKLRNCMCRTSELLIGPAGYIFRCTSDVYANRSPIGHLLDDDFPELGKWRPCAVYGRCNSCDIKIKTNRFQEYGHSSVEIKEIVGTPNDENNILINDVVNTYGRK